MTAFLVGCLGVRSLFVVGAKKLPSRVIRWTALPALLLAIGWVMIYRYDLRPTGREAGGVIWWNELRPIHAAFYAAFAVLAVTRTDLAYIPLLADVIFGFLVFIAHHLK